jgi:acetoin utilization protein AcuB
MTTHVVTVPSKTSISDAKRIMEAHRFERLPVVDNGKLVGIVTARRLESVSPSKATSLTIWELTYLLQTTPVKEIMEKKVMTTTPDSTVEEAVTLAQLSKVGALVVLKDKKVVGIVTTNDLFYKIINPILGVGAKGTRLEIARAGNAKSIEKITAALNELKMELLTIHIEILPGLKDKNICLHVDSADVSKLVTKLEAGGFKVTMRKR